MTTVVQTVPYPKQQQAVNAFLDKLLAACKSNIVRIYLFGSQARGEAQEDSDIDILIITSRSDWQLKHRISHIAADVGLEYDVLIDSHIVQKNRWEELGKAGYRFYQNVMDEGIPLVAVS